MSSAPRLARVRAAAQGLHRPAALRHPADVCSVTGPVQAQEQRAARLAFRARSRGLTAADVDRARIEERSLLRAWCMRGTVHLICTDDAGWLLSLFAETIVRLARKRLADFGLDRRRQDRALKLLRDAVDTEGALTRPELAERLERAGFETGNEFKVHLWVLATLDGELCLGPDRGGNTCLVRTADWIGKQRSLPREQGLAELARRYLRGYGPADERDLARWAGLPLRDARTGFERIASEMTVVEVDGRELQMLGKRLPRPGRSPVVRLLGAYDNYNLGYTSRDFALDPAYVKRIVPGGGIVRPAVSADGRLVASWSSRRSGNRLRVEIEPFGALEPAAEEAIAGEVADLGRFEGLTAALG